MRQNHQSKELVARSMPSRERSAPITQAHNRKCALSKAKGGGSCSFRKIEIPPPANNDAYSRFQHPPHHRHSLVSDCERRHQRRQYRSDTVIHLDVTTLIVRHGDLHCSLPDHPVEEVVPQRIHESASANRPLEDAQPIRWREAP